MKKKLLLASLIACSLGAMAQGPTLKWTKLIDSPCNESPLSLIESSDGKIITFSNFGSQTENSPVSYDGTEVGQGCATTSNANNYNALILKTDLDGNKLWNVYSNAGNLSLGSSSIAATHDGGAVAALKMNYAGGYPDKYPLFVDASGSRWTIDNWNTGYRVCYIVIVKIDGNGDIQWLKKVDIDVSPEEAATTFTAGTPDAVDAYAIAVDENNNIYLGGRYRKTLIFTNSANGCVTLTPHNTEGWNGDSQKANGDMFLVKLDGNGNYLQHLTAKGINARDQITDLIYDNGKIYFTGNMQAAEAGHAITIGKSATVTPTTLDDIFIGCADTTLNVTWATTITAYAASNGKHTTQIKNMALIDGNLYVMGHIVGGFGASGSTKASIASTGTMQEGFIVKCSAADGSWAGGAVNGKSIGGYYGIAKGENKIYGYGYKLGTIYLDEYDEASWEKTKDYDLITGGGMCTAWSSLHLGNNLYTFSRCNSATTNYYNSDITTTTDGWGSIFACWDIADLTSGTAQTSINARTSIYGMENGVKIITPNMIEVKIYNVVGQTVYNGKAAAGTTFITLPQGIYLVNDTKVAVR